MKKKTHDEFIKELIENNIQDMPLETYKRIDEKILFKCVNGHTWYATPRNILSKRGCPICNRRSNQKLTHEEFLKKLYNITDKYTPLEEYQTTHTKILCRCEICKYEWKVEPSKLLSGKGCPVCAKKLVRRKPNLTHKEFLEKLNKIVPDIECIDTYINQDTSITFKCKKCGYVFTTSPGHILNSKTGCKECFIKSITKTNDKFVNELKLIHPSIVPITKYINSKTRIQYFCKECKTYHHALASNLLRGYGCPICATSKGEKRCMEYFKNNNITYISQYEFHDLIGLKGGNLRFDFGVFKNGILKCLIEYDGIFHFQKMYDEDEYETLKIHDELKNNYCNQNNIPLLRINYKEFDNIEQILDDYLQNILNE